MLTIRAPLVSQESALSYLPKQLSDTLRSALPSVDRSLEDLNWDAMDSKSHSTQSEESVQGDNDSAIHGVEVGVEASVDAEVSYTRSIVSSKCQINSKWIV